MDATDNPPLLPDPVDVEFDDGFEDDDYVPVVAHKRERLLGTSSYLLLAALLVVGGFVGGAKWKSGHPSSTASGAGNGNAAAAAAFAGRDGNAEGFAPGGRNATGGAPATGGAATTGGAGGATIGQIKLVDGTNVYVEDAQGNVVKVATGPDTTIQVSKTGTVADLKAGDTVVVQGPAGSDGTVAATNIASGTGLGGGFGRRQGTQTTTSTVVPQGG
jgi:hypothetical protein